MRMLVVAGLTALLGCTEDEPVYNFDEIEEVEIKTNIGSFVLRVDGAAAPVTHEHFLIYVEEGYYDGSDGAGKTIFHRVLADFVVQGGGYLADGTRKVPPHDTIVNESDNGLGNVRGTVAMARSSDPDSANSQFFVNHVDNPDLDRSAEDEGYCVFAEVIEGMEIIDEIAALPIGGSGALSDAPLDAVVVQSAKRL